MGLGWADVELCGPVKCGELRLGIVWHGSQGKVRQCKVCHGTVGNCKAVKVGLVRVRRRCGVWR